jgi:hypothetical protein
VIPPVNPPPVPPPPHHHPHRAAATVLLQSPEPPLKNEDDDDPPPPNSPPLQKQISEESYDMFLDPVTFGLMADPVLLHSDGNTYDRSTLIRYFDTQVEAMERQAAGSASADETSCGAASRV